MKKKLAIVNHNLGSGGAEKLIYDMALEIKKRRIDFSIILLTKINCIYGKKLIDQGVNVIYLSDKWDIYNPINIFRLKKVLKDYDVIHTHIFSSQLWTAFASLFLNKKLYITTEHNTSNNRREKIYFKYLDKWMYSRYNFIVSITEEVQKELKNWIGIESKYLIIKNGINLDNYKNIIGENREKFGLNKKDKLICQIARLNEVKSHETSIEALLYLSESYKLLLLGEGERKKVIEELIKKLNLEDRVKILGYRNNIPQILEMCDVSILTSRYEGLPISAIESMRLKPFIGSRVPGITELIEEVGELFRYRDSKDLANKIQNLCENEEYYKKIKERCRKKAEQYNIVKVVSKYLEIYGVKNEI